MANSNFAVINSQFNPFTYDELVKPIQLATEAQNKVEDAYTELMTKAATVESMADQEQDKDVYMQYKIYADKLKQAADNIAMHGIDPSSRRTLMGLNKEYAEQIVPIQTAYARRQQLADEQRKGLLSNPTALYDRDISQVGLKDFMDNPNLGYKSHSGAVLTKQASDMAGALAKEIREGTPYDKSTFKHQIDKYTYELIRQFGVTREDVLRAIYDPENANPALTSIVKQVYDSSGINDWDNQEAKKQAAWYASQGLWSAVGETKFDTQPDFIARLNAQAEKELQVARAKARGNGYEDTKAAIPLWPTKMQLGPGENDYVDVFDINIKNADNVLNRYYSSRKSVDGKLRLKEIQGLDKKGNIRLKDSVLKYEDLYDNKGNLIGRPTFRLSPDNKVSGIVMSLGSKTYLLEPNSFDRNIAERVFGKEDEKTGARDGFLSKAEKVRNLMLYSENPEDQEMASIAYEKNMQAAIRTLVASLTGNYEEPTYSIDWTTSQDRK